MSNELKNWFKFPTDSQSIDKYLALRKRHGSKGLAAFLIILMRLRRSNNWEIELGNTYQWDSLHEELRGEWEIPELMDFIDELINSLHLLAKDERAIWSPSMRILRDEMENRSKTYTENIQKRYRDKKNTQYYNSSTTVVQQYYNSTKKDTKSLPQNYNSSTIVEPQNYNSNTIVEPQNYNSNTTVEDLYEKPYNGSTTVVQQNYNSSTIVVQDLDINNKSLPASVTNPGAGYARGDFVGKAGRLFFKNFKKSDYTELCRFEKTTGYLAFEERNLARMAERIRKKADAETIIDAIATLRDLANKKGVKNRGQLVASLRENQAEELESWVDQLAKFSLLLMYSKMAANKADDTTANKAADEAKRAETRDRMKRAETAFNAKSDEEKQDIWTQAKLKFEQDNPGLKMALKPGFTLPLSPYIADIIENLPRSVSEGLKT